MKKFTLASLLVFAAASANEPTSIRDLWYFAPKGVFGGISTPSYLHSDYNNGASSSKQDVFTLRQTLNYSLFNNFSLFVDEAYITGYYQHNGDISGLTNPGLGLQHQAIINQEDNLYYRGILRVSPTLGRRKSNNQLSGYTSIAYNALIGQVLGNLEYHFGVAATYYTETSESVPPNIKPRYDIGFTLDGQYDINQNWAAGLSLGMTLPGTIQASDGSYQTKTAYVYTVELGPSYLVSDKLSIALHGSYSNSTGESKVGALRLRNSYGALSTIKYNFN